MTASSLQKMKLTTRLGMYRIYSKSSSPFPEANRGPYAPTTRHGFKFVGPFTLLLLVLSELLIAPPLRSQSRLRHLP